MKIFNIEDDGEVVYVQKGDMAYVTHSCDTFPGALLDDFFSEMVIINGDNRNEFVRFTNPSEIEFFENQDWIINYREFVNLTEEEIIAKGKEVIDELNEVAQKHNESKDAEEKDKLYRRHELLEYKLQSIKEFLWYKQGHIKYDIPVVPDSKGFFSVGERNSGYQMRLSLEPNKVLLYKKDGQRFTKEDKIPKEFIEMGVSVAIKSRNKNSEEHDDYETTSSLSEDGKYLIIEYKPKSLEKKQEEKKTEEKGIRRLVKKFFGGKKQ